VDDPKGVPRRIALYHQTVFDALHTSLLNVIQKFIFLYILKKDMLVLLKNNSFAIALDILEEVITALLKSQ
jgi:hypothetical protein